MRPLNTKMNVLFLSKQSSYNYNNHLSVQICGLSFSAACQSRSHKSEEEFNDVWTVPGDLPSLSSLWLHVVRRRGYESFSKAHVGFIYFLNGF